MQNLAQYLASQYGRSLCISHFFIQGVGLKVEVVCHICMFIPVQYNTIQYSDLLVLRRLSSAQPSVITSDLLVLRRLSSAQCDHPRLVSIEEIVIHTGASCTPALNTVC